jgi:hypothetical protein
MEIAIKLTTVVFLSVTAVCCSKATLNEEELLKVLVKVNHVGPLNFRRFVWPLLEKKTITYCGQLEQIGTMDAHTLLRVKVDKLSGGEKLPWSLEGKATSLDIARSYKPGEPLCMTGTLESFAEEQENLYCGYVNILSLTKSVITQ